MMTRQLLREEHHHAAPGDPATVDHHSATRADNDWKRWLVLAMSLFAAIPLMENRVACGAGMLALFGGLLVLCLVVEGDDPGHSAR